MKKPPTDVKILRAIYSTYLHDYSNYTRGDSSRRSKIYVPIEVDRIAKKLKCDPDIVFGRLYYYMDKKFRYTNSDGSEVNLFALAVGDDRHAVNFPLLASIYAQLEDETFRADLTGAISIVALTVSVASVALSLFVALNP